MELALDTSTAVAGVALAREGRTEAELSWRAGHSHTAQLMPAVDHLLRMAGAAPRDLTAVVVAIGPGSFSGLRVGVSAAKALAESLAIPLAGVGTMLVEACPFLGQGLPTRVVLDGGRGELAVGSFHPTPAGEPDAWPEESEPPRLMTVEELCASIRQRTLICGEGLPAVQRTIEERLGALAVIPPASALPRRPGHLAALGWRRLARGERDDAATLQPIYLRGPSITRPGPARAVKY